MSKRRWYDIGVTAAQAAFPDVDQGYICPLCGDLFSLDRIGELSVEHVPPAAIGGKALVLTCSDCNNRAGHEVDAPAVKNQRIRDLLDGTMTEISASVPGRTYLNHGYRIDADLRNMGGGIVADGLLRLSGPPLPDSPRVTLEGDFRRWQFRIGDLGKETVSWLKSAYLVAFAALGYRYLALPGLEQVRDWIRQPEKAKDQIYHLHVEGIPEHQRGIMIIPADGSPEAIAVQFGTRVMFLPGTEKGATFYTRLHSEACRERLLDPSRESKLISWPTEPMHLLDL